MLWFVRDKDSSCLPAETGASARHNGVFWLDQQEQDEELLSRRWSAVSQED
jgi:hypothetical protein